MALRVVKDKLRPESPRLKDLARHGTARERTVNHGADGRFVTANGAANGREAKTLIRESLGTAGADPEMVRQALTMYRAILRELQNPLAEALLAGGYTGGQTVKVDVEGEKFTFHT